MKIQEIQNQKVNEAFDFWDLLDRSLKTKPQKDAGGQPTSAQPGLPPAAPATAPGQPTAQAPAQAPATRPAQSQVNQAYQATTQKMRQLVPNPRARILPTKFQQDVKKDLPNVRYNKDWSINVANRILKYHDAGYNVADLHKTWMAQHALGKQQKTIAEGQYNRLNELLEEFIKII